MSTASRIGISLALGGVIFAGVPLLAWGMRDIAGYFQHPARFGYIVLILLLQLLVIVLIPSARLNARDNGNQNGSRPRLGLLLLQIVPLAIVLAGPFCDRREILVLSGGGGLRYLGLGFLLLGFALMHWAVACLGRQFSVEVTVQEGHSLITEGAYRYVRHPRYLGTIMFFVGFSLLFRSTVSLSLAAALTAILFWRMHEEEALMHKEFGSAWESYSAQTWRLIPFVY